MIMPRPKSIVPADRMILDWPNGVNRPDKSTLARFFHGMIARLLVGWVRYGFDRKFRYMTRMEVEVKAYRKTGNVEHLVNIANYAYMESVKPENPLWHLDNTVGSVTRGIK